MEKVVLQYLDQIASIFNGTGSNQQKDWYLWQRDKANQIAISKIEDLPLEAREALTEALETFEPQEKQCHWNSWKLSSADERFGVASGWALSILPLEHSWSTWIDECGKKWHFDITAELVLKEEPFKEYVSIVDMTSEEAMGWGMKTKHGGPYLAEIFMESSGQDKPTKKMRLK